VAASLIRHAAADIVVISGLHEVLRDGACDGEAATLIGGDSEGCGRAIEIAHELQRTGLQGAVTILGINLGGGVAQGLLAGLRLAGVRTSILLVSFGAGANGEILDGPRSAALACRLWGCRVAQQAHEVSPLGGGGLVLERGRQRLTGVVLGALVRVDPVPTRSVEGPTMLCRGRRGIAYQVRVLGQEGAEAAIVAALTHGQRELEADGARVHWRSETIRPGRLPGMELPGIGSVTLHTVQLHGGHGARHAGFLRQRLESLEGSTGPGTLISSWVADDIRDCTLLGVPRGAIPIVTEACRACQVACGGKLIMMAGGLAIIGIDPSWRPSSPRRTWSGGSQS
jgi:hypothetical protein